MEVALVYAERSRVLDIFSGLHTSGERVGSIQKKSLDDWIIWRGINN